jgi:outer membrane protein assembly factor BamA
LKIAQLIFIPILLFLVSSCTRYKNYRIPYTTINSIKLQGQNKIKLDEIKSNIAGLKESNLNYLSVKLNSYLRDKRKTNDSTISNKKFFQFFNRKPIAYNPLIVENNKIALLKFYRNKGFLKTNITYYTDTSRLENRLVNIFYQISEGPESVFTKEDSIIANNVVVENEVKNYINRHSLLHKYANLDLDLLKNEKENLSNHFKNLGYFNFSPDFVGIKINDLKDTSLKNISLIYQIPNTRANVANIAYDRLFRFGPIDFKQFLIGSEQSESSINKTSRVSPQLKKLISIHEGDLFSIEKTSHSLQNIYETDQFKSVSIQYDTNSTQLYPRIELTRNEKYNISSELGGSAFRGIPGPFLYNSLKIRRVFSELDYLDFSTRLGFEAQSGFINTDLTRKNLEINLGVTANFPSLFLPQKFTKRLGYFYGAKTQLGIGYDYIDRPEYIRTNFKILQRYLWKKTPYEFFQISLFDLNIINTNYPNTETSKLFTNYLDELRTKGNNLFRSFNPSFVSSINLLYTYRTFYPSNQLIEGKSFIIGLESGGTTLNLFSDKKLKFVEDLLGNKETMQFYRFLRLNVDFRKYMFLGEKRTSQLAYKFIGGIAYAYGEENDFQLPYEKNFFIGGPSSLRAWKPRRLGPGSRNTDANLIEQPGSVLIESSVEYRFKILKFLGDLNGALFLDAGNIWGINYPNSPLSNFKLESFIDQIAVGTGFGIRYDFNYFILRLDMAVKIINPAKPKNEKWVLNQISLNTSDNPIEFNIGIGYPF